MNTPYPDRFEREALRAADEMRIAAERLKLDFERLVEAGFIRYRQDPVFHAEVYQLARVIDSDRDFHEKFDDDNGPDSAWEMALGLALKTRVAMEAQQPGGILHLGTPA